MQDIPNDKNIDISSIPVDSSKPPKKSKKKKPLGTAKAIETMYRNAYRAELDIIALAATKANIMISLNGFIVSALMISGAFIFASSPVFLIPAGIFLFTAAASIVFSLLAASPEKTDLLSSLFSWIKAVLRREAGLRDFHRRVIREQSYFIGKKPNILIYEDRAQFSKQQYWERMRELMQDRDDVYYHMSDQLYWLGLIANKKFKLLRVSYSIFRWGLLASILSLLSIQSIKKVVPYFATNTQIRLYNLGISEFKDIYEPSAVQQLPDGRLLVVEDEASRAFSILSFGADGTLVESAASDVRLIRGFRQKLNDLEGLALDGKSNIYAITSHSRNKKGERRSDREQLLRFNIISNNVSKISNFTNLTDSLKKDAQLRQTIIEKTGKSPDFDKINIEGLEFDQEKNHLLLGLRKPMINGLSMIISITNPDAVFDKSAAPQFSEPSFLDLNGGGIRSLNYDPVLNQFLIVNEIIGSEGKKYSQLWAWSGETTDAPTPVSLPDIISLNNVESLDSVILHGESRLLIMSDEGNAKKQRPAKYMLLNYEHLMK